MIKIYSYKELDSENIFGNFENRIETELVGFAQAPDCSDFLVVSP
jgi:hypothetical protein